ncbi:threonine-phosphate decarboxylase CobD, partial [Brevundimonas sp.]
MPHKASIRHGGGLMAATKAYPHAPLPWLDLSTGINPVPWCGPRADIDGLNRLPDPCRLIALEAEAARVFGASTEQVCAVSGAETAIRLLPLILGPVTVDIVEPTYGAHQESWRASSMAPNAIGPDQIFASRADVLVIVNPNNPDGRLFDKDTLEQLARQRSRMGQWLIVDESFIECAPEASVAGLDIDQLIVLRSFGKFYGLAGLRLGFMIASPVLKARLRALTGDWPVSAEAIVMGHAAYADTAWRETTRLRLNTDAEGLDEVLWNSGFEPLGGTCLFRLVRSDDAREWFSHLCDQGILTRPFDYAPDWLRFGV